MTRRVLLLSMIAAFFVGALGVPAYAARTVSPWKKVFGHSTSCTLIRSSINSDNDKSGGQIHNFYGCSSSASSRAVPPGYFKVRTFPVNASNRQVCHSPVPPWTYNSSTTSDLLVSTSLEVSTSCPAHAAYFGSADGYRYTDAGSYEPTYAVVAQSAAINF